MTVRIAVAYLLAALVSSTARAQDSPRDVAMRVADRIVAETIFEFKPGLPAGEQEGFYFIDFFDALGEQNGAYFARASIRVDSSVAAEDLSELALGLSFSEGDIQVEVAGNVVYSGSGDHNSLEHLDYNLIRPAISVPLDLDPGDQELVIRFDPVELEARLWLGLIRTDNELSFDGVHVVLPDGLEAGDSSRFLVRAARNDWMVPAVHVVSKLPDRLAFTDWRYFTGTFLDAMYAVSDEFEELDYEPYISAHMDFFLQQRPIIERERRLRGLIESPFGHYFRFSLLDDMGMQSVPFAERLRRHPAGNRVRADREIVDRSLNHVMYESESLADDGTWARLNPDSLTVWADDMFMGSVLLSRMSAIDNQPAYLDEAAKQVLQIHGYLNDPASNLYWHGYFARNGEHSSSKWGRANGWTMMAMTELLQHMPADHPRRDEVLIAFRDHAAGILAVQAEDGRWHQVLDNPDTYLETSCTAMFTRAFAQGVVSGWLPEERYREAAEKGWAAVATQVQVDGRVEGIVRGTPIFYSDDEYENHPTRLNDPRGLGAVLYAATAMHKLETHLILD